ncbi:DoxX [Labilithrix luteola]|uniref:DoxX n=1 Tax=Labilithrix luteola TaxID=1391654 RepID=A0A0K1Q339_9BACT|nr:DoxX family protein [Labilithrix luteola]AKV00067.1 DoxX [Labilithrix luteola]
MAKVVTNLVERMERVFASLSRNVWFPVLLARLAMAAEFVTSGWGKVHDLPKLAREFESLGIPAPGANAAATATTELVGGLLLLVGLGTRFAAASLAIVMTVAILTSRLKEVHTVGDFFYLSEPSYFVIFVWLVFQGGGKASVDHLIAQKRAERSAP